MKHYGAAASLPRGRPAVAASLDPAAVDAIRRKVLKTGSAALVYRWFADDPRCPDDLREYLIAQEKKATPATLPISLRRAASVTPEAEAMYRGPVAYGHIGFKCRHSDKIVDPRTGEVRPLMAGDLRIYDDMSFNQPFWFELEPGQVESRAHRGDKLAARHGVAVGRQALFAMDARGKVLGCELICRARDAYTAADVLRFMRRIDTEYGLERVGRILEKSVWQARTITGQKVIARGDDGEIERAVAGLASLGVIVEYVHTSEGKALIEGWFHHFQKTMSLDERSVDIGRRRGEMERESRTVSRVQAGVVHPADAGLPHYSDLAARAQKAMAWLNGHKKYGRIQHGVPDEVYYQDTLADPLRAMQPEHAGVYMPMKYQTEIRQGCVVKKIGGQPYRFTAPELFAQLGAGYRLAVAFDPTDPSAGAELYNLETGSRNVLGAAAGAWLGHADWEAERVLFGYTDEVAESLQRRARFHRAFKAAFVGTGIFGQRAARAVETRDGVGNVALAEIQGGRGNPPRGHLPPDERSRNADAAPPAFAPSELRRGTPDFGRRGSRPSMGDGKGGQREGDGRASYTSPRRVDYAGTRRALREQANMEELEEFERAQKR